MLTETIEKFIAAFGESLEKNTFVKLTVGNYKGADTDLQKILIRSIEIKKGNQLSFLYRSKTCDTTKNYDFGEGLQIIKNLLGTDFFAAHLFTTENDFQLEIGKRDARFNRSKPTFETKSVNSHNREKKVLIDPKSYYLKALGVTTETGDVKDKQQDKWRQINKFVETIGNLFDASNLKDKREVEIIDMGSGKGYLTFAVYDYFNNVRKIRAKVVGIETRRELVDLCNEAAQDSEFDDLRFVQSTIDDFKIENVDVLIALHACNTATDDAIFKGIMGRADLIICAPCCHKELRPQIKAPAMLKDMLKHGSLLERTAETLTDGLRALLLEKNNYKTKVFEFISTEHTPKNNMIVGIKNNSKNDVEMIERQIEELKNFYNVREQRLETLLEAT